VSRSLRVRPECVKKAKSAVRKEFVTQQALAESIGYCLDTVSKFLNGKRVDRLYFLDLCEKLGLNSQEIADLDTSAGEEVNNCTQQHLEQGNSPDVSFSTYELEEGDYIFARDSTSMEHLENEGFALPEKIAPVRNWVGRSRELDTLKSQILNPQTRAITITAMCVVGLAGIGKTTLASKLVRQLYSENASFVAATWESLRSVTGIPPRFDGVMDSLLLTLSSGEITPAVTLQDDYFKKTERLVKLLRDKPCLIVLDNVETILKTKQAKRAGYFADEYTEYTWLFRQLVETEHQSKVIFTSRESLAQLQGRETYTLSLGGLDQQSAVTLLRSFDFTANSEELAELAKRYEGHPKALEIVAAVIQEEFNGQAGKFLRDRKWLLIRDLDSLIDEVINRLSDEESICISQISVYQTPEYPLFYDGIAAQMPETSERDLKENIILALKRRQLLNYNHEHQSFQIHPLVQEKASYLLNHESSRTAHRRAYGYFFSIAKLEAEWKEFEDVKPLLRAHYHACQAQDWDEAASAVFKAYEYLRQCSHFELLINLYETLIPDNWKDGEQLITSPYCHIDILCNLGYLHHCLRQYKIALEYLQHSLSLSRLVKERQREARSLLNVGLNYLDVYNSEIALEYLHKCLKIVNSIKDYTIKCKALEYIGVVYHQKQKYDIALIFFKKSLDIARQISSKEAEGIAFGNLGGTYIEKGEYGLAIKYLENYLKVSREIKNLRCEEYALHNFSIVYNYIGDYRSAINFTLESRKISLKINDREYEGRSIRNLAIAQRGLGEYQNSINSFKEYLKIARELSSLYHEADALYQLGITQRDMIQNDCNIVNIINEAIANLKESLNIFQQIGNRAEEARVLIELTKSCRQTNTVSQEDLQNYLNQAEQICIDQQLPLLIEVREMKADCQNNCWVERNTSPCPPSGKGEMSIT